MNKGFFIDRDGVICQMVKYAYGWDSPQNKKDVVLTKGIEKLIRLLNQNNIPVIEITNQPGVAKGKMTQDKSEKIEQYLHKLLLDKEARVDEVYVCPHHPNGVIKELSRDCHCRKPKPGLLKNAAGNNNLLLGECLFLGDKESDVLAARAVGCKTAVFLHSQDEEEKVKRAYAVSADFKSEKLDDIVEYVKDWLD